MVPGMYGTHCKHCSLIPPLVSNNNLALLRCGYMCAGMLVDISRHQGKTSCNNNKRCLLWIRSMLCHIWLYRVLLQISDFMIIILYLFISCLLLAPCSYLIISWVFPAWYQLLSLYLLLHTGAHDTVYNAYLWLGFIDTHVLISARHLAFASPLAGEFWLLWILMSRFWSLERVNSPSCWSEWRSGSVDPQ